MRRPTRRTVARHATYANIMSTIAVFAALSGTAYAAVALAPNSVGTAQLRDGAVTKQKLGHSTIKALAAKPGPRGHTGLTGATGPAGAAGPAGVTGPVGPSDVWSVAVPLTSILTTDAIYGATGTTVASVNLPPGRYLASASVTTRASDVGSYEYQVRCVLRAGSDTDEATATHGSTGGYDGEDTLSLQLTTTVTAASEPVVLTCAGGGTTYPMYQVNEGRLSAVQVAQLH